MDMKEGHVVWFTGVALTRQTVHLEQKRASGHGGQQILLQVIGDPSI